MRVAVFSVPSNRHLSLGAPTWPKWENNKRFSPTTPRRVSLGTRTLMRTGAPGVAFSAFSLSRARCLSSSRESLTCEHVSREPPIQVHLLFDGLERCSLVVVFFVLCRETREREAHMAAFRSTHEPPFSRFDSSRALRRSRGNFSLPVASPHGSLRIPVPFALIHLRWPARFISLRSAIEHLRGQVKRSASSSFIFLSSAFSSSTPDKREKGDENESAARK